ncbi:hypothetical protein LJR175_008197 [Variovorax sp. LjRoot175]|uniref:hypothetical protein n=1 Tax=Variovorax sp. LjRoot175 TaxID=3342276 RepID=UPI003ECF68E4
MTASSPSNTEPDEGGIAGLLEAAFEAEGSSVFGAIAREVGLADVALTMKGLQLLYWLRSQHPLTRPVMVRGLAQWRGSGRNEIAQFEPAHSAPALLDRMVKDELLWEMGGPTKRVLVSPKCIALLSRLHPACEDLDLPWRLARWEGNWPASENEAERYVRSFVSRQRSYLSP